MRSFGTGTLAASPREIRSPITWSASTAAPALMSRNIDAVSWEPYELRGVKVAGSISVHVADEEINLGMMDIPLLVLRPERKWSWGFEEKAFGDDGTFRLHLDGGAARPV